MNKTQLQTTIAPLIGVVAGYLAGAHVLDLSAGDWTIVITGVLGVGSVLWPALVTRAQSLKDTVGKMPATTVVTDKASADALPNNPDVVAATPQIAAAVQSSILKTVVNILLVAFVLSVFLAGAPAFAQTPRPRPDPLQQVIDKAKQDFTAKTGVQATGDLAFDLLRALDVKLLPDLNYALLLAKATKNDITATCWQSWINVISVQQTAVKDAQGNDVPLPDPHLVTGFERMVELRNMLQPDSDFMRSCSPVASMVKKDITDFMGVVIGGGASLTTLIPGL